MKYCPICQIHYADDSLLFCLEDGTKLLNRTNKDREDPTQFLDIKKTVVSPANRNTDDWELSRVTQMSVPPLPPFAGYVPAPKSNSTNAVAITVGVMCLLFLCSIGGWIWLRASDSGGMSNKGNSWNDHGLSNSTPQMTPKVLENTPIDNRKTNSEEIRDDNLAGKSSYIGCFKDLRDYDLDGFLERSANNTPERCIATCRAKGFKYAGVQYGESCLCGNSYGKYGAADNCNMPCTGDAGKICGGYSSNGVYATSVKISLGGEEFKACDRFVGSGIYNKWKEMGGESGKMGCPATNETEAPPSPNGTTGRMAQFSKGDGGYLIWHGSGRFKGVTFEVSGCMFKLYSSLGGTKSWLGFPLKDGYRTPTGGARQDFEAGFILWDSKTYQCQAYRN
jgi:hypothetical protein